MANENMIKFLRGNVADLPQTATAGALYFTKDEGVYLGLENGSYHRYGDFITVADVNALPTSGAHATCMYYCTKENILARYDAEKGWIQINKQPTAEEMKTLLGLGDLAYLDEVAEDNLAEDLATKINNKVDKVDGKGLSTNDLTAELKGQYDTAYTHSQAAHAPVDAQANVIESVKVNGEALEIKDKAVDITIPESTKVEASETNGNIKVDGNEVTVYTHPDKHVAADISDLDDTIKGYNYATKAYVGDIPNGEDGNPMAASVIAYINKKTDGIATSGNLEALGNRVGTAEGEIDTLQGDVAAINNEETGILANAKAYVDGEDIFETDMNTINALGGIAAGTNLNGLTTHDVLKKLLYPYVDATVGNATASPNGGTYEKGVTKTLTSVSISITKKSEPITSVALYNDSTLIEEKTGDAVKNGGTITFSGLSVEVPTNGNQLTIKVTYPDANGNAKTVEKKTTALTFVYPYYIGTCAAGTAIDETLVESLTKKVEGKGNGVKSHTFSVSDGHMIFAYPAGNKTLKSILDPNGFETLGNYTRHDITVTGLDGTAQSYYVYVSGATTVDGFTVKFTHNS